MPLVLTHWGQDKMAAILQTTLRCIFLNENATISIKISLKLVPKDSINDIPSMVQIMVWRWPSDKPLSEPVMFDYQHIYASLNELTHWGRATHICVGKLTIIGSNNGLSPGRRQAII